MNNKEIRDIFYHFFESHHHQRVLSAPLVPAKDPTLLFTNAGMNQFKGVFLQQEKREYQRAVTIQKCMRVSGKHNDFDEVGKTDFHHTFFEMLGNFSFGDYFKEKAIALAWEILTQHYQFSAEKLWITVFEDDDEAAKLWHEKIGVPTTKIIRLGEKDNFWQMGDVGPCGPCSEIHFDRGEQFGPAIFNGHNPRYVEIWNLVFMQFYRNDKGQLQPLPAPSIDTGMGLERLSSILQGVSSNYQSDLFIPIIQFTAELAQINPSDSQYQIPLKVIADHIRALTFLIGDGVMPANDGRGYVLRRILRRAVKHGKSLNFKDPFLHKISHSVINLMKPYYPELEHAKDLVAKIIEAEEYRFNQTLASGLKLFDDILEQTITAKQTEINGFDLFKLSDTYGFPIDFARDLAIEKGIGVDYTGFQKELTGQKERSRQIHLKQKNKIAIADNLSCPATRFVGYEQSETEADILAVFSQTEQCDRLAEGQKGFLVFNQTTCYAKGGGQLGDSGTGKTEHCFFIISDTTKTDQNIYIHEITIEQGFLKKGETARIAIDEARRKQIATHHSATHLLHAALRETLGLHIKQAGSYVGPDKLRFDFTHFQALTQQEIQSVEDMVNAKIRENIPVEARDSSYNQAISEGAMAIFEEKYGDRVRLISMSNFSKELCGGTHLQTTGEIGIFKITAESSISSGIRRIEAHAGIAGLNLVNEQISIFNDVLAFLNQKPSTVLEYIKNLDKKWKEKEKEFKKAINPSETANLDSFLQDMHSIGSVKAIIAYIPSNDRKYMSDLANELKNRNQGIVFLFSNLENQGILALSINKELTEKYNANIIIKQVALMINGKGGGRADFAQAGGDEITDIDQFKCKIVDILNNL